MLVLELLLNLLILLRLSWVHLLLRWVHSLRLSLLRLLILSEHAIMSHDWDRVLLVLPVLVYMNYDKGQ